MKWSVMPQSGDVPPARSSHSLTAVGPLLFLFGGEHSPRIPVGSELYVYDRTEGAWQVATVHGTPPSPRLGHTAAAVGDKVYVFGGRGGTDMSEAMDDLHVYDTTTATWSLIADAHGTVPPARSYHTMTALGTELYVFGGCGGGDAGRLNDLYQFSTTTKTWSMLPAPSAEAVPGRGGSCLVASAAGDSLFVVAGFCGRELGDMHEFRLADKAWCGKTCPSCAPTPAAAAHAHAGEADAHAHGPTCALPARSVFGVSTHACSGGCAHGNHIIAFGGEVDPSDKGHEGAGDFTDTLYCFEAGHGWHKVSAGGEAPCPRGWFAATTAGDGSFVVHGGLDCANERLGDMYKLVFHEE